MSNEENRVIQVGQPDFIKVVIIGSGPGGMLAAWRIRRLSDALGIMNRVWIQIYEAGGNVSDRVCNRESTRCQCNPCNILEGRGGAGGWSDGKITLTPTRGVHQDNRVLGENQTYLLRQLDDLLTEYGVEGTWHDPLNEVPEVVKPLVATGWQYDTYPLRHMGSDGLQIWVKNFGEHLRNNSVRAAFGHRVTDIFTKDGRATGVRVEHKDYSSGEIVSEDVEADYVVVATGLAGVPWFERWLDEKGIQTSEGPADFGLRLETPKGHLAPLIDEFYDVKLTMHSNANGIKYRSFCVNGDGFITNEHHRALGIRGVNGYSCLWEKSGYSNMAILAKHEQGADHLRPKREVLATARAVNEAGGGYPIVQRLGDFMRLDGYDAEKAELPPTNIKAVWGDLAGALPEKLYNGYREFLTRLSLAAPGVMDPDNLLYGPEIKYYGRKVSTDRTWRSTEIGNLFVVGNASGQTASLSAAALAGMIAGKEVLEQARSEHGF